MTVDNNFLTPSVDTHDDLIAARNAIKELLESLGVTRVISVDDQYSVSIQKETVVRRLKGCDEGSLEALASSTQQLAELLEEGALIPIQEAVSLVDDLWDELPSTVHKALAAIGAKDQPSQGASADEETDLESTAAIKSIFDDSIEVELLSLADWRGRVDSFVAPEHGGVLVLFDRDFTKEDGSETEGDVLAADLAARKLVGVHCGLLTHSVASFEGELAVARSLPSWPATSLIVLNKGRLNHPGSFASGIQAALLARGAQSLRDRIVEDLAVASQDGLQAIKNLDAYSMLSTIKSSLEEGIHEFEGPSRIFHSIYNGVALRRRGEIDNYTLGDLGTIRSILGLASVTSELPRPQDLTQLEQGERYIDRQTLTEGQLPLEVGDIFEFVKGRRKPTYYLLLVQACDLTIRADGQRAYAPKTFSLAKILVKPAEYKPRSSEFELPLHELASGDRWFLSTVTRIQISPDVLDATVVDAEGRSVLRPSMEAGYTATPGFAKRIQKIANLCRDILAKYSGSAELVLENGCLSAPSLIDVITAGYLADFRVSNEADSSIDLEEQSIAFGIKRVARLNEVTAGVMLRRMSDHHNRPGDRNGLFREL